MKGSSPSAAISADYEELLRETSPTIADVASPDHLHTEHTIAALEAGCDVLVEKPLAVTVEDTIRTLETAERENAVLVVNYTLRFQYPTQEALQYALDGKLGEPFLYQGYYVHDLWEMYSTEGKRHTPWRVDPHNPQNVLLGGGCHPIDLILTAADSPPVEVSAYANGLAGSGLPVEDCYTVNIAFESGAVANVLVTTGVNGVSFTPGYFNVYGTDGTILKDTLYRRGADPQKLARMTPELDGGHNWQAAFEGSSTRSTGFCRRRCRSMSRRSTWRCARRRSKASRPASRSSREPSRRANVGRSGARAANVALFEGSRRLAGVGSAARIRAAPLRSIF